jgi:hypothetical protein
MHDILMLDATRFKKFLSLIERDIRYMGKDWDKIRFDFIVGQMNSWWEYILRKYGVSGGMLFEYNNMWVEILADGSGDYRTLLEFLEDAFGGIENWLSERVFKGYVVKIKGEGEGVR